MIILDKFFVIIGSGDLFFVRGREGDNFMGTVLNIHNSEQAYSTTQDKIRYFYLQPGDLLSFINPNGRILENAVKVGRRFAYDGKEYSIELIATDGSDTIVAPLSKLAETLIKIN